MLAIIPILGSVIILAVILVPLLFIIIPKIKNSSWLNNYVDKVEHTPEFVEAPTVTETMREIDESKKDLKANMVATEKDAKQQQKHADEIRTYLKK